MNHRDMVAAKSAISENSFEAYFADFLFRFDETVSRLESLQKELEDLKFRIFGAKSERVRNSESQISLFDELINRPIELNSNENSQQNSSEGNKEEKAQESSNSPKSSPESNNNGKPKEDPADPTQKRGKGRRSINEANLQKIIVQSPPIPDVENFVFIGNEITKFIEFVPGKFVLVEYQRAKYIPIENHAANNDIEQEEIVHAEPAPLLNAKMKYGVAAIAQMIIDKACEHIPLFRQEFRSERNGFHVSRSTLSYLISQVCEEYLNEITEAMFANMKESSSHVMTDACGLRVRYPKENGIIKYEHMQCFIDEKIIIYRYFSENTAEKFEKEFGNYKGNTIQCDAASTYDSYFRNHPNVKEVGCSVHSRRNFWKLRETSNDALTAIAFYSAIYKAEQKSLLPDKTHDLEIRLKETKPIWDKFYQWAKDKLAELQEDSQLKTALTYLFTHKEALERPFSDGKLRLDNNYSELMLRHVVKGLSNWLFCGSPAGAKNMATILSLVKSCILNKLEPFTYLREMLTILPVLVWRKTTEFSFLDVAPFNWAAFRSRSDIVELLKSRTLTDIYEVRDTATVLSTGIKLNDASNKH